METAGQALIDGYLGNLDSGPSMVFGCGKRETCSMGVPHFVNFPRSVNASPEAALIHPLAVDKSNAGGVSVSVYPDGTVSSTCEGAGCVWVGFSETPVEVPVPTSVVPLPASLPVMLASLGGLGWIARRKSPCWTGPPHISERSGTCQKGTARPCACAFVLPEKPAHRPSVQSKPPLVPSSVPPKATSQPATHATVHLSAQSKAPPRRTVVDCAQFAPDRWIFQDNTVR